MTEPNKFSIDKGMILKSFDSWTYTKGYGYFQGGEVVSWKDKNGGIQGKVKGSWSPVYTTELRIENDYLRGTCSCPVGNDCKHCVALALQWADDRRNQGRASKNKGDTFHEEHNDGIGNDGKFASHKKEVIPKHLLKHPIQGTDTFFASLPRADLEKLTRFFMKAAYGNANHSIFSPDFITTRWRAYFERLDSDYNVEESEDVRPVLNPSKILDTLDHEKAKEQSLRAWFEGYVSLLREIKIECQMRGMLDTDSERLYDYYKNKEYDRMEEEVLNYSEEGYKQSYYNEYEYFEPFEEFDLDNLTLKSYLEEFFTHLNVPVREVCDYILRLHEATLQEHRDYLINEHLQWLRELKLPLAEFGISSEDITALMDLKSMIEMELSTLIAFSNRSDQLDMLYSIFTRHPSRENSCIIMDQLKRIDISEKSITTFLKQLLQFYKKHPNWKTFSLLEELIGMYLPKLTEALIQTAIDTIPQNPDAGRIMKGVFQMLDVQPVDFVGKVDSALLQSSLMATKTSYIEEWSLFRETFEWLLTYYTQKQCYDRMFLHLETLSKHHPKLFEFRDFQTLKNLMPSLPNTFTADYNTIISRITQKGRPEVSFQILLELDEFEKASKKIPKLPMESYYSDTFTNTKWTAISDIIPHISQISKQNKQVLVEILNHQIEKWLIYKSRNRPDMKIANSISMIQTIFYAFSENGESLWKKWFKSFAKKHWRLHNLRKALKTHYIELRKPRN